MKQQIRLNVFETNSSTQHALVIRCDDKHRTIKDGVPEGVKLPEKVRLYPVTWQELDKIKMNTIDGRLLFLYNMILAAWCDKSDLVCFLSRLQQLGINYELSEFNENVYHTVSEDIVEKIMHDKEIFTAFVFANDVFYDTYADDCGSWEQQEKWLDTIDTFVKESKQEVIHLHDRC